MAPESKPADPSIRSNYEPHMTYTPTLQHTLSRVQMPVVRLQLHREKKKGRNHTRRRLLGESGLIFNINSNGGATPLHVNHAIK